MRMIEPHRPDIQIIFPIDWKETDSADQLITRVIDEMADEGYQVTSTLLPELRRELKEVNDAYLSGDKSARHKDYDLYNLLVNVLNDIHAGTARSGKNYYDRKTDVITYQSHYQTVEAIDDKKQGQSVTGLKVKLHLVKRG